MSCVLGSSSGRSSLNRKAVSRCGTSWSSFDACADGGGVLFGNVDSAQGERYLLAK